MINRDELRNAMSKMPKIEAMEMPLIMSVVESILDDFDFLKVYDVMKHLNWGWGKTSEETGDMVVEVPSLTELRNGARSRIIDAIVNSYEAGGEAWHSSSGGFDAMVFFEDGKFDSDHLFIKLKFVVTEWDNYE